MKNNNQSNAPKKRSISYVELADRYYDIAAPLKLIHATCSEIAEHSPKLELRKPSLLVDAVWQNVEKFLEEMDELIEKVGTGGGRR